MILYRIIRHLIGSKGVSQTVMSDYCRQFIDNCIIVASNYGNITMYACLQLIHQGYVLWGKCNSYIKDTTNWLLQKLSLKLYTGYQLTCLVSSGFILWNYFSFYVYIFFCNNNSSRLSFIFLLSILFLNIANPFCIYYIFVPSRP